MYSFKEFSTAVFMLSKFRSCRLRTSRSTRRSNSSSVKQSISGFSTGAVSEVQHAQN